MLKDYWSDFQGFFPLICDMAGPVLHFV
jgi:hypothetical protein